MGAGSSTTNLRRVINEEFSRLRKNGRNYLVLSELLDLKVPASHWTVSFSHLATLFVMNRSRDGRVTLQDMMAFLDTAHDRSRGVLPGEFPSHMHGYCTLQLLKASATKKGLVLDWVCSLLTENCPPPSLPQHPGRQFITKDALSPLYDLLDLQNTQGLSLDDFWNLLQRVAEEQGSLPLDDESLDSVVSIEAVRTFMEQLLDSMVRSISSILTLTDIG